MKPITYILFLLLILFQSCENVMDRNPLDKISGEEVWNNETLVSAYVYNLIGRMPLDNALVSYNDWYSWCDEGTRSTGNSSNTTKGTVSKTAEDNAYWDYAFIRDCNIFLEKIADATITEASKKQLEGEVRFLRAFAYFEKMKRYGGVPLVDVVIDPFQAIDDKYTTRAKEEAVADFIDSELTKAVGLLTKTATPKGGINKWTAFALKAGANLWAASIAKYGTVQLDGIVGIPAAKADSYYTKASAAADSVIASGNYSLYNALPDDKSENYRNIFLDEGNSEVIYEKVYDGVNVYHSYDGWCGPTDYAVRGGLCDPTLEFIMEYENIDGSADQPVLDKDHLYASGAEPFANKDPRLFGTVFFQGDKWSIGTIESYDGLDPSPTPDPTQIISHQSLTYEGIRSVGYQSRVPESSNNTKSGFTGKKYIDGSRYQIPEGQSKTNWIIYRLAEMFLTVAEAQFELGNITPAVTALNMTRNRAGISLVDAGTITLDKIRSERRAELAFECNRWWDLRRWRSAMSVLNGRQFHGLQITFHYVTGKYYFIPYNCETFTRTFKQEHYYNPITTNRINNNPMLIENPLY